MRPLLAAGTTPAFFAETALLLVVGAGVAYACHRLRVMPIISFLATGALLGPHALGVVQDEALVEAAAEVGVVLLLFTIGIEFSLARLGRIKRLIFAGGGLQVGLVVGAVTGLLLLLGVDWRTGVFTGCLLALSSTAIVMKLLMDRGETNTEAGQAALGILIFQDLAVVAMVLVVPMLGGGGGSAWDVALALGKAAGIVALVLVAARRVMPAVLEAVARTCSQEIFGLTVVAICFGTAYLTSLAGVSLSLGAFLAGLMVSESRFREMAFGEILPLQILFSATFFISVGLLLDLGFVVRHPLPVLALLGGALLVKAVTTGVSLRLLGFSTGTAAFAGLLLGQVGEFSFVLERTGRAAGLYPAGLQADGPQAFITATVVLMIATPALSRLGEAIKRRMALRAVPRATPSATPPAAPPAPERPVADGAARSGHVVVAGYGEAGRRLARVLSAQQLPYVILTMSPEGALEAEAAGQPVLLGNYTRQHELTQAGLLAARMLVVADDDLETTRRVVSAARALHPALRVVARTRYESEVEELQEAGATDVVAEEQAGLLRLLADVLEASGVDAAAIAAVEHAGRTGRLPPAPGSPPATLPRVVRLSEPQQHNPRCAHTAHARPVVPATAGCAECLAAGDTWVHLRICMTCGHVGCCDSSKNKHARKHFHAEGHPIVRSFEAGEAWAWCYEDEAYL